MNEENKVIEIDLNEKEVNLLYALLNTLQCNMLSRMETHLKMLDKLYGFPSVADKKWLDESREEYDLLMGLKSKLK
jgi:hypothetical protein